MLKNNTNLNHHQKEPDFPKYGKNDDLETFIAKAKLWYTSSKAEPASKFIQFNKALEDKMVE